MFKDTKPVLSVLGLCQRQRSETRSVLPWAYVFSTTDISTTSFQRQQCAGCYSQYCFSQTHSSTASDSNKAQFLFVGLLAGCTCQQGALLSKRALFSIGFYCHLKQQVVLIAADLSSSSNFFFPEFAYCPSLQTSLTALQRESCLPSEPFKANSLFFLSCP